MKDNNGKFKTFGTVILVIVLLLMLLVGIHFLNPLTHSNNSVKKYVLRTIPIGTTYDEVLKITEKKGWEIEYENENRGLMVIVSEDRAIYYDDYELDAINENPNLRISGSKSLQVLLGEYYNPFPAAVYAWMVFDDQGKMTELFISRDIDGI
ncbi:MAG: hypothetical protein K5659_03730 [Lachnospiraceae bacterium]|nr:hypothetical protein [Lachnospiraceae bacterium]